MADLLATGFGRYLIGLGLREGTAIVYARSVLRMARRTGYEITNADRVLECYLTEKSACQEVLLPAWTHYIEYKKGSVAVAHPVDGIRWPPERVELARVLFSSKLPTRHFISLTWSSFSSSLSEAAIEERPGVQMIHALPSDMRAALRALRAALGGAPEGYLFPLYGEPVVPSLLRALVRRIEVAKSPLSG